MSSLLTRVISIIGAFAIVTAIGFSIPALVQNSTTAAAAEVQCPCPLKEYFKLQTKFAKEFGIFDRSDPPDMLGGLSCFNSDFFQETLFVQRNFAGCDYRIFAGAPGVLCGESSSGEFTACCRAIVFGQNNDPCTLFNVAYLIDGLTDAELAACREEIIRVARSFQVTC